MKKKGDAEAVRGYTVIYRQLTDAGVKPNFQIMDKEASAAVKSFLKQKDIAYQLVPPHIHRRNTAEQAICTFKSHFVAGQATIDGHFPTQLWCQLVHQATITLNLLRNSRLNKKMSVYAQIFAPLNFDATPLAPSGT
jgi:hypothetical protein